MSRALEYAFAQGVTHRDLKLTNVLMGSNGIAKLIDFGLATEDSFLDRVDGPDMAQALEYATLERATGAPRHDPSSDLYFLGGILYELLTGKPPYARTKSREERKDPRRYLSVRPVEVAEPTIPSPVATIVGRLMQTDLDLRYVTPSEVIRDLLKVVGNFTGPVVKKENSSRQATVLCVESRPKHQDILRKYFPRYGYRVLLVGDAERALMRAKASPPDCCLLMGEVIGNDVLGRLDELLRIGQSHRTAAVVVLSKKQEELAARIPQNALVRTLVQPVNLGDLRREIDASLEARSSGRRA